MWPIQLAIRFLISCRIFLCSLTLSNTYSFLTWSVQPIFSILLQHHISKLSRRFWSFARRVQFSAPYRDMLQTWHFTSFFLKFKSNLLVKGSSLIHKTYIKRLPAASSVLYTTSCEHSVVLLRMGEIIARNMFSCLKFLIKILYLHLVGCLYYCISDARPYKHQKYLSPSAMVYSLVQRFNCCHEQWHCPRFRVLTVLNTKYMVSDATLSCI